MLKRAVSEFAAVVVTGPRQSGNTTLLQQLFGQEYRYLSLELPDVRAAVLEDPRSFLARFPPPVIFDEVQWAPELLPYVKERIDEERNRAGQFLLSGSQNPLLPEKVTESLAGRTAMLRLLPMSRREMFDCRHVPLPWEENDGTGVQRFVPPQELWRSFLRDFYAELVTNPDRDVHLWHSGYVQTYLERDVRSLRQVGYLMQFQSFLGALAARTGQLLNLSDISRDLGVAANTAKAWLSVLEVLTNRGMDPDLYFWRTSSGEEVDLLVQVEGRLIPLEVKQSATPLHERLYQGLSGRPGETGWAGIPVPRSAIDSTRTPAQSRASMAE